MSDCAVRAGEDTREIDISFWHSCLQLLSKLKIKRLDKTVDQEGNLINMDSVLEIVGALERLTVTPEVLEATRIGRALNLVRKKTTNEELSKGLKRIVKKWQALLVSLSFVR